MKSEDFLLAVIDSEHPVTLVTVGEGAKLLDVQVSKHPTPSWLRQRPAKSLVQKAEIVRFLTLKIKSHAGNTSRNS